MPDEDKPFYTRRYELLQDRRRRVVLPHQLMPALSDLHGVLAQLFDAVGAITSDPRWREASDHVRTAAALLRGPIAVVKDPVSNVFEGIKAKLIRKPMANVRGPRLVRDR